MSDFTFIDLFAGIGGTRLAFEAAGGRCVFTSEWDKFARQTYEANFDLDHPVAGDIREIQELGIPNHDVLVAGFPCQPFSLAGVSKKNSLGRKHGFSCPIQGNLFFDIARIIQAKQPSVVVLENVKNLLSHDKGRTFKIIIQTLEIDLGYKVTYKLIDAQHFVPQHRERIFIVASKSKNAIDLSEIILPSKTARLEDILHAAHTDLEFDARYLNPKTGKVLSKYTLTDNLWTYLQAYAAKHRAKGNGFGYGLFGPKDVARTLSARYHKDGSEILIKQSRKNPRRLTPREAARLMGFPDRFQIPVSDTQAYRQFGNSVVVPVVEVIANIVADHLRDSKETQQPMSKVS